MLKSLSKNLAPTPARSSRDPLSEMRSLMSRFFEDLSLPRASWDDWTADGRFQPKVELHESPESIDVIVELAGIEEKDIDLEVTRDALSIRGEKHYETDKKEKNCHYSERAYGSFYRSIPLPAEVDREKAEAHFKQGLLKIKLPKSPAAKTDVRKIAVKVEK